MRILPITLAAVALAIPAQLEIVVRESSALAQADSVWGFGHYDRPWALDLTEAQPDTAVDTEGDAPQGRDGGTPEQLAALTGLPDAGASEEQQPMRDLRAETEQCEPASGSERERLVKLLATEKRVKERIGQLTALKAELEELLHEQEALDAASVARLVNLYKNMKPSEAAEILEEMDPEIVVRVVEAMKERQAAPILAKLPKDVAREITKDIALRRSLKSMEEGQ